MTENNGSEQLDGVARCSACGADLEHDYIGYCGDDPVCCCKACGSLMIVKPILLISYVIMDVAKLRRAVDPIAGPEGG